MFSEKTEKTYTNKLTTYEIIISDDSHDENTQKLIKRSFTFCKYLKGPQKGPSANRNNGVKIANGNWIIFIDDDCYVNHDFLQSYYKLMQTSEGKVYEGKIICPDKHNNPFYRQPENTQGGCLPSGNFLISKDYFNRIGQFDEEMIIMEDMEFALRIKRNGDCILFCEDAIAFHPSQKKPSTFYWHWIFHFKWQLLLRYKCGQKSIHKSIIFSFFDTIYSHIEFILRLTIHLLTKHDHERYLMYWFERILAWITMPITLLHLIYWDYMYRTKIKNMKIKISAFSKNANLNH